jgi:hypothetical protein
MKKLLTIVLLLSTATILLAAAPVSNAKGGFCPPGYIEKDVWMVTDTGWAALGQGNPGAKARCWTKDTTYFGACNKELWHIGLNNEASVAQWLELTMHGDGFHWGIRKVGEYAADCNWFNVRSNDAIVVTFNGFEDLLSTTSPATIEAEYAFTDEVLTTPPPDDDPAWLHVEDVNALRWYVPDTVMCEGGLTKHIWTTIETDSCTPCENFRDPNGAMINITLQCIQPWINRETGDFASMPEFPPR